jgi:hypothetical protein
MIKYTTVIMITFLSLASYAQSISSTGSFQPINIQKPQPAEMPLVPASKNPTLVNNQCSRKNANATLPVPYRTSQQREYQELMKDVQDRKRTSNQPRIHFSFPSHLNDSGAKNYVSAYNELVRMLKTGQYEIKKAVFLVENAYLDNRMNYDEFSKRIENIGAFCMEKLKQDKKDMNSNDDKNDVLFHLLSDTITIKDPLSGKKVTHFPVHYDFDDYMGEKEWSNMFVSKLLNTNYGQCHSMPMLFKIVAEEIGADCYLATSPSHLYIKYKKGNQWKNVELTNGHITSDDWLIGSGYIKSEAIKSRIYLDTISDRKTIALCLEDLAKGYALKFGGYDDFALKCINTSLTHFPNYWVAMAERSDYYTLLFQYVAKQTGYKTLEEVLTIPQAKSIFDKRQAIYLAMDNTGYTQMPPEAYEDWLKSLDKEKRKQEYERYKKYKQSIKSLKSEKS